MGFCKDEFQATKHAREKSRYSITKFEPERRWKCFLEIAKNEILREIWPYYEKGPVMKSLCRAFRKGLSQSQISSIQASRSGCSMPHNSSIIWILVKT